MMNKIENISLLNPLIEKDKIATANVIGRIKYEDDYTIYVDNILEPRELLLKSKYWNVVYSNNGKLSEELLNHIDDNDIGFGGILLDYYNIIKEYKNIEWSEHCYLYYIEEGLNINDIKHKVSELRLEDAEIVNKYYTYKNENSIEYIKDCIKNRETSCIFDNNGNPISWAVVREDGSMGIMYTKKEHRGKGLAKSVSIDLANKIINNGDLPYVHIVVENKNSIKLAESIGFKRYSDVMWFGIKE